MRTLTAFFLTLLATTPLMAAPPAPEPGALRAALPGISTVGGPGIYTVVSGDNLAVISGRLGTPSRRLRADNPDVKHDRLKPGQTYLYDNRHIAPAAPVEAGDAILVNVPQRMLFLYRNGAVQGAWPVAAGRADKAWRTPVGEATITTREKDKTWIVPPSIQAEMRAKGEPVLTRVEPGPKNPLGRYWLGLSIAGLGIHGTNAPSSIYSLRTHGCIRMQPEHIEALFNTVARGTPVRLVYAPILLYAPPGGPVWLEVHPDAYARRLDYLRLLRELAGELDQAAASVNADPANPVNVAKVTERIDWAVAESALKEQSGLATDVARRPANQP